MMTPLIDGPEAPLAEIASGRFHGMERPLYVAAASYEQLRAFCEAENLLMGEVRRFDGNGLFFMKPGKVVLLLPGWWSHEWTDEAVKAHVRAEGYTVEMTLEEPLEEEWWTPGKVTVLVLLLAALWALWLWISSGK